MAKKKKEVTAIVKLQAPAGKATPAPPIGPALGPHGVSTPQFVRQFNDATKNMEPGLIIPVELTVYSDRTYEFVLKTPPASVLLKKAAKINKGSQLPHKDKVASITRAQIQQIAEIKMPDMNANDIEAAIKIIAGTARSMGVTMEG